MVQVVRTKLMLPPAAALLPRPRLMASIETPPRVLLLQAPSGAGKTAFLAQWLPAAGLPFIYYRLDESDRTSCAALVAHLRTAFARLWPDWQLPDRVDSPEEFATELVSEMECRPPLIIALDALEAAFGRGWLTDFLGVLFRYAPAGLHLVLSTRAPLPVDPGTGYRCLRAADLAFTREEAGRLLGEGEWMECWSRSGGFPLALQCWRQHRAAWQTALTGQVLSQTPDYVPVDIAKNLIAEWLTGKMSLDAFAHQVAVGQPGAEQLWSELREIHWQYCDYPPTAHGRAIALWDSASGCDDRPLMAAAAMLVGEIKVALGEYAQATEWYWKAFEIDPMLELTGCHSKVVLLRDQGRLDEAEALGRRCLEARQDRGDLTALAMAHLTYGQVCMDLARLDEAEQHFVEAERLYETFSANIPIGITAKCQRALVAATHGDMSAFRKHAEQAYSIARGRFRFLEACAGMVLAAALVAWGEHAPAERLLASSFAFHSAIESKFYLHYLLVLAARKAWAQGDFEEARRSFDRALGYAAAEGYLQHLAAPRVQAIHLITDALARGVEPAFCQELLIRMGERAMPSLLEMTRQSEPAVRRAALYPLASIGGDGAAEAIRALLRDDDQAVKDAALIAYQSVLRTHEPPASIVGPRLSINLLGPVTLTFGGAPVPKWRTTKARDLLAYFTLASGRPLSRDQLIEALWPDVDCDSARTLLHTTLYNLRSTLGTAGAGLIKYAGGAYLMDCSDVALDLLSFERLAACDDEGSWRTAVDLYRGDLLEGLDYPWCEGPRTHARRVYQATLRRLAARLGEATRHAEAVEVLQLLLQVDPLDEGAHLGLMKAYAALDNRTAALAQYRTLARLLDDELGLEPGTATQQLYRSLLD